MTHAARDIAAALAVLAAIAMIALGVMFEINGEGWLVVFAMWPIYLFGFASLVLALVKRASKWLLLIAPIFLVPAAAGVAIIYACTQGSCL